MTPADEPTGPRRGPPGRYARLGRQIALGLYAVAVVYVVVSAFVSIPPQIFTAAAPDPALRCQDERRALEEALLDALVQAVDPRVASTPPDRGFWRDWDRRIDVARASCPDEADSLRDLRRLRYRAEGSVTRHERSAGSLARRLHRTFAPAPHGPASDGANERP